MDIEKKYLEPLYNLLKDTDGKLSLSAARLRDKSLKDIEALLATFYSDRELVFKKFAIKKENGDIDFLEKPNGEKQYQFKNDIVEELKKELEILLNEYVTINQSGLKEIIELSEYKPKIGETELIDELIIKIV